ncbi:MAG: magnesium transporter CorA [Eubacterium sp.]|nr:magnesium transporter CorA [Eubacterium sp.]HBE10664.1 magnesium transporter CorA [Lachnospiraceae bacterium]
MYFLIKSTLEECSLEEVHKGEYQYVVVLTPEEWKKEQGSFDIGIEMDLSTEEIHNTKAEVNYDSLTGTFCIPSRRNITENDYRYAFAIDEKGIVFIDPTGVVNRMVKKISLRKKWKVPCLERFIYDFLELIIARDLSILEGYERELDDIEGDILDDAKTADLGRVNEIRGDIRDLRRHYDQLIDLGQELEENENNFFKPENTRYFRLFTDRMSRLHDTANSIRDYTVQIRDLYHTQMEIKQNRIMTLLTVVTTIFMPLTLIVGWYGMNFRYMPELESRWGYPIVIIISLAIIIFSLLFFKKKKWL